MNTIHSNVFWKENPRFILENYSKLASLCSPSCCAGSAAHRAARQAYRPVAGLTACIAGLRPAFPWQRGVTGPAAHGSACTRLLSFAQSHKFNFYNIIRLASLCSTSRCAGSAALQDVVAWRTQIPNLLRITLVSLEHTEKFLGSAQKKGSVGLP